MCYLCVTCICTKLLYSNHILRIDTLTFSTNIVSHMLTYSHLIRSFTCIHCSPLFLGILFTKTMSPIWRMGQWRIENLMRSFYIHRLQIKHYIVTSSLKVMFSVHSAMWCVIMKCVFCNVTITLPIHYFLTFDRIGFNN